MERVVIKEVEIKTLANRKRKIRIILPKDYYDTKKRYPVLYMHDGQNLIDKSFFSGYSWDVLNTMDRLHDITKGLIIVGIDCHESKRILEYSPYISKKMKSYINKSAKVPLEEIQPEADQYGEFIVNQLKTMIDMELRTKKDKRNTFIAGSSCGGVISIYLGLKYQDVFSIIGAFSPAYRFLSQNISKYINDRKINSDMKIYHDMGMKENGVWSFLYIRQMKKFQNAIKQQMNESNIMDIKQEKALHNEYYWAIRFNEFLNFCFRDKS